MRNKWMVLKTPCFSESFVIDENRSKFHFRIRYERLSRSERGLGVVFKIVFFTKMGFQQNRK
jgi:hypothetical protein